MSATLVVIPAWNEAEAIGGVLSELAGSIPTVDCLVVDDGSTDSTREVAERSGVPVLSLPFNLGVGGAMRAGFRYAERWGYETVIQVDADGQHDPADIFRLLSNLDTSDIVIGARFAGVGDYSVRGPRRWVMKLLASVLSRRAGVTLTDVTSGFRAAGPRAIRLFAATYPAEYLGDTVESLTLALKAGLTVSQVPVSMRPRSHGTSSASPLKAALFLARAVLALVLALIRAAPDPALTQQAGLPAAEPTGAPPLSRPAQHTDQRWRRECLHPRGSRGRHRHCHDGGIASSPQAQGKYAALWIVVAVGVVITAVAPGLLTEFSKLAGVKTPSNLLFFVASLLLLLVCVHLSVETSRLEDETRSLAEEVALLRLQVEAPRSPTK